MRASAFVNNLDGVVAPARRSTRQATRFVLALVCTLASLFVAAPSSRAASESADTYTAECSFTNPAYSGQCTVSEETQRSVSVRDACNRVLSCLNDNRCVTKTYCNATTIRSGWKLVSARATPKPTP